MGREADAVTQTWTTFFSQDTSIAQKKALLQNGTTVMASAMAAFASNPAAGEAIATVRGVSFPSETKADVTYSVSLSGQMVENAMVGNAVYQDGTWLVADTTLCGLLQLAASQTGSMAPIPGCTG